jgi:hypothetical protein
MARLRSALVRRSTALPEPVLRVIMLLLPVDARGRCAAVCRAWRDLLSDYTLWQRLDMTFASGLTWISPALVRGAAARAAGQLLVFVTYYAGDDERVGGAFKAAIEDVIATNADSLLELHHTNMQFHTRDTRTLLEKTPHLQAFVAKPFGTIRELLPVLRNEPPFGPVRAIKVEARLGYESIEQIREGAAALAGHTWLTDLTIHGLKHDDPGALNALLDAASARRLVDLGVNDCRFGAQHVPALARVLHCGSLEKLFMIFPDSEPPGALIAAAFQGSRSLVKVLLRGGSWQHGGYGAMLDALKGLPALSRLEVTFSTTSWNEAAAGAALGALLAANSPNFRALFVTNCFLDRGMQALDAGRKANTHPVHVEVSDQF